MDEHSDRGITQLAVYTAYYILPSRGLYNPYHLLPEPEQSIDLTSEETFGV